MDPRALDWDDLRIVLAIAQKGTVRGAARFLGLTHATVGRRLSKLEEKLKTRLFERTPQGQQATSAGHRLMETAKKWIH